MAGIKVPPNNEEAEESVWAQYLLIRMQSQQFPHLFLPPIFIIPVNGMIFWSHAFVVAKKENQSIS